MKSKVNNKDFKKVKVLVIGDSCVDRFVYGDVQRLAPEGPIPIFNPTSEISTSGMAGNVHRNLESIGCESTIVSNKINPIKTRYVDERSGQLMIRVDESDKVDRIDQSLLRQIQKNNFLNNKIDAIVISDYDKGFLTEEDIKYICENNNNVFVDTKKIIGDWICSCTFIKINHVEYENVKKQIGRLELQDKLIITLSSKGCKYRDKIFPVEFVQVKDVSGAGDTFLSGLVSEYIRTNSIEKAILFAQYCATIVVQKKGVSTI